MIDARVLRVEHETAYDYPSRVDLAYHIAYLRPAQTDWQAVTQFQLEIDPLPSSRSGGRDVFGNPRELFSIYGPHDKLHVRAVSSVRVAPRFGALDLDNSPPWDELAEDLRYQAGATFQPESEFVFGSPFVPILPALRAYAAKSFRKGRPLLAGAVDLMCRVHQDFTYDTKSTDVSTPVATAFAQKRGVCQDFAHVSIGALRALGLPAAYVSGYLLSTPPPGQPRLIGADASHAWVRVWCPINGWVDFDPTNDCFASAGHVTLAVGRDYGDVTPLRGVIRGGGHHTLRVGVSVLPVDER